MWRQTKEGSQAVETVRMGDEHSLMPVNVEDMIRFL